MKAPWQSRSRAVVAAALLVAAAALPTVACGGSSASSSSVQASPDTVAASPSWEPTMKPCPIPTVKSGQKPPPFSKLRAMFAYDTSQPLGFEASPAEPQPGCTVDAVYFDVGENQATGYLVTPEGEGPFPVVVYAPGWQTDVIMFMDDAVALAQKGYAGLLLQEPNWATYWTLSPRSDCQAVVQTVTQVRRGLDLLETQPKIDARRIGFVGWSNGAHLCGGIVAGVDERIKAYVLIGMARPTSNYRILLPAGGIPKGAAWDRLATQLALWDPVTYLARNRGSAFLLLNGKGDPNAMQDATAFLAVAPKPKTRKVYRGGHSPTPAAAKFWQAWMLRNL
jgi:hypothetical protein